MGGGEGRDGGSGQGAERGTEEELQQGRWWFEGPIWFGFQAGCNKKRQYRGWRWGGKLLRFRRMASPGKQLKWILKKCSLINWRMLFLSIALGTRQQRPLCIRRRLPCLEERMFRFAIFLVGKHWDGSRENKKEQVLNSWYTEELYKFCKQSL